MSQSRKIKKLTFLFSHSASWQKLKRLARSARLQRDQGADKKFQTLRRALGESGHVLKSEHFCGTFVVGPSTS